MVVPRVELIVQRTSKDDADEIALCEDYGDVRRGEGLLITVDIFDGAFEEVFEEGEEEATILSAPLAMRKQKQDAQVRRQQKACKFFRHKNALVDKLKVNAPLVRKDSSDFESPTHILSRMR